MTRAPCLAVALLVAGLLPAPAIAQQDTTPPRVLRFGGPPGDTLTTPAIPDSVLRRAVEEFNRTVGLHSYSDLTWPAGETLPTGVMVYRGRVRIDGSVQGNVVVINGDLLVTGTGRVVGNVTVLGGRLLVQPGGSITGTRTEYAALAGVARQGDGSLVIRAPGRSLSELASNGMSVRVGPAVATLGAGISGYNRVEGAAISVGPSLTWKRDPSTTLHLDLQGSIRSASSGANDLSTVGWTARLRIDRESVWGPVSFGLRAEQVVAPMADQPFSATEASLSAFFFHRDYRDWFARKGWGVFATIRPRDDLTLGASFDDARERSLQTADPFSLFQNSEPWRLNPLADDGKIRRLALTLDWDTRNNRTRPTEGWRTRVALRRIASNDLNPLALPTTIRAQLPTTGYGATMLDVDVRRYLPLGPDQSLHLRATGHGWIAGDPILTQDRLSLDAPDLMTGYDFRAVNCERRRSPDPALPALCDRALGVEAEFHRTLPINIGTHVGRYTIGLAHPQLVLFAGAGTAWLAGDSAGRVPSNRIQQFSEWRSEVGVGLDNGWLAVYLGKALADPLPARLIFRLRPRF